MDKDIPNGVCLTGFFSNYPAQQTVDEILTFLNTKQLVPGYGAVYTFEHIREAITAQDEGKTKGKMMVKRSTITKGGGAQ